MKQGYAYLASPYSHENKQIMEQRFHEVKAATAWLLQRNDWVYSPIVHCHQLALDHQLPTDFKFWKNYDKVMILNSSQFYILKIHGWVNSKGVTGEIKIAAEFGIPQYEVNPITEDQYSISRINP